MSNLIADEYPAVLRQMVRECGLLFIGGGYSGTGATLEQVRKIFSLSGVKSYFQADLD